LVRDTKYADLREPYVPIAYYAAAQNQGAGPGGTFLIRSSLSQAQTVREVNRVLAEINPGISVSFQGFKSMIDTTVLRERLMATVSSFFGGLALLLACIGVYGVLSYRVASRTNEIGIRAALGAQRRDLYWLILREALLLLVFGLVVGLPLTFGITRLASALLFELGPNDPLSLSLAALTILAVSLIAGYIPSRRATRVDPWIAVRCE
jgi:ABC-type antimicrobial peptide transport system permease subunit